jgi:hypothetical protein
MCTDKQVFDLGEVAVELSAEFDQQSIVGKFKQQFDWRLGRCLGGGVRQSGDRQNGLPELRRKRHVDVGKLAGATQQIVSDVTNNS